MKVMNANEMRTIEAGGYAYYARCQTCGNKSWGRGSWKWSAQATAVAAHWVHTWFHSIWTTHGYDLVRYY